MVYSVSQGLRGNTSSVSANLMSDAIPKVFIMMFKKQKLNPDHFRSHQMEPFKQIILESEVIEPVITSSNNNKNNAKLCYRVRLFPSA